MTVNGNTYNDTSLSAVFLIPEPTYIAHPNIEFALSYCARQAILSD